MANPFIRNQATKPGECCDCECDKRDGPCDCCDCCPDVDLPNEVCVYCVEVGTVDNTCCSQSYNYCGNVRKLTLQPNSCTYIDGAGADALKYDSAAGFWKGTFCGEDTWPVAGGCEHVAGKYFNGDGDWVGGVVTDGVLPAEVWLPDCACTVGDPPCDCVDVDGNPYTYPVEDDCVETSTDPCCLEVNRICPESEGNPPATNGACP